MRNYLQRRNNDFFGLDFFSDVFDGFFAPSVVRSHDNMRTDVKETEKAYELAVDMPGFDKKDITVELKDGYLTVSASKQEKEEDGKYVRRERSYSCSRSYYVGDGVTENDVKAKYNNGTLNLFVPKKEIKQIQSKNIQID